MGMMSELDIARQNVAFKVSDDDDFTTGGEAHVISRSDHDDKRSTIRRLFWYDSGEGHLRLQLMALDADEQDPEAYRGPSVDVPAPLAQRLRALIFDE